METPNFCYSAELNIVYRPTQYGNLDFLVDEYGRELAVRFLLEILFDDQAPKNLVYLAKKIINNHKRYKFAAIVERGTLQGLVIYKKKNPKLGNGRYKKGIQIIMLTFFKADSLSIEDLQSVIKLLENYKPDCLWIKTHISNITNLMLEAGFKRVGDHLIYSCR